MALAAERPDELMEEAVAMLGTRSAARVKLHTSFMPAMAEIDAADTAGDAEITVADLAVGVPLSPESPQRISWEGRGDVSGADSPMVAVAEAVVETAPEGALYIEELLAEEPVAEEEEEEAVVMEDHEVEDVVLLEDPAFMSQAR